VRFLSRLLGRPNPTQGWVRDRSRALKLDLDRDCLSDVRLGSPFAHLAFLGPARRSRSDAELWEFPSLGVAAEVDDDRIVAFYVVPIPDEYFEFEPYNGAVAIRGRPVPIAELAGEQDVVRAFGAPANRDADPEEIVLFYEKGTVERQIELTPEGRIKTIAIFSHP